MSHKLFKKYFETFIINSKIMDHNSDNEHEQNSESGDQSQGSQESH